ncbi:hypothetical protein BKD30_05475 [Tersicoccus phoenicis]|uniref:Uncharacterized protein n=1 Tax=Tersicoccus phoenicis TaxID=554083 RepID=A0A1R1LES3_9MICC|nr:hypothetical protein BKD30_05475 [Tersicoccus phoenicis]
MTRASSVPGATQSCRKDPRWWCRAEWTDDVVIGAESEHLPYIRRWFQRRQLTADGVKGPY